MSENSIERLSAVEPEELVSPRSAPEAGPVGAAPAPRRAGAGLAVLALALSAGALAGGGWLWWQQQALAGHLAEVGTLRAELDTVSARAQAENRRVEEAASAARGMLGARLDQLESSRDALSTALSGLDTRVAAHLERRPESWRAAEAEYLVRLASLRLAERDLKTAARLLNDADERVRDLAEAGALRTALAQELGVLRTAPAVDVPGLVLRIEGLLPRLSALAGSRPVAPAPSAEERAQAELESEWSKRLSALWTALKRDWIEVRHYQGVSPELELPEVRHYLDQNLALALQQAEWAVTRGDSALYQAALARAETWVQSYFDPAAAETQGFLAALAELKAVDVAPALPTVEQSLVAARELVTRLSAEVPPATSPEAPADAPAAEKAEVTALVEDRAP